MRLVTALAPVAASLVLIVHPVPEAHADARRGERVFQRCYACHSVIAGEDKLPGPNLRCVLGRRAGTWPGFEFSDAMTEAGAARGLAWSRATLDAFLSDPQASVPGTTMSLPGLPAEDRRDVIDYLEADGRQTAGRCAGGGAPDSRRRAPVPPPGSVARPLTLGALLEERA